MFLDYNFLTSCFDIYLHWVRQMKVLEESRRRHFKSCLKAQTKLLLKQSRDIFS